MIRKRIHAGGKPSLRTENISQEKDLRKILEYNYMYNGTLVSAETGMTTDSLSFVTANRLQELRHQQITTTHMPKAHVRKHWQKLSLRIHTESSV